MIQKLLAFQKSKYFRTYSGKAKGFWLFIKDIEKYYSNLYKNQNNKWIRQKTAS